MSEACSVTVRTDLRAVSCSVSSPALKTHGNAVTSRPAISQAANILCTLLSCSDTSRRPLQAQASASKAIVPTIVGFSNAQAVSSATYDAHSPSLGSNNPLALSGGYETLKNGDVFKHPVSTHVLQPGPRQQNNFEHKEMNIGDLPDELKSGEQYARTLYPLTWNVTRACISR